MSYAKWARAVITGATDITDLVSTRVTPYLRNRETGFPCIVYSLPREDLETVAGGDIQTRHVELQVQCMSRSHVEADEIAEEVIQHVTAQTVSDDTSGDTIQCVEAVRPTSIEREFQDSYDGSPDLIYITTVNLTLTGA